MKPPSKFRTVLGKAFIGALLLVAVVGLANRLTSNEDSDDPARPPATTQAQLLPTATNGNDNRAPTRVAPTLVVRTGFPAGFVPASWVSSLPGGVNPAAIVAIYDGDTLDLNVNGQTSRYRLYRADTPENHNPLECGGNEATAFVQTAIGRSDTPGEIWVEDVGQLDRYGRTLAYLWFTVDGQAYLLNHVLINSGWAENVDYGDAFDPYRSELTSAATYATSHGLGVWSECGAFGLPIDGAGVARPQPALLQPTLPAVQSLGNNCHSSYIPCVKISPVDLDCRDIGFRVEVIAYDEYRLDNDDPDLIGCEAYPPKP